VVSLIRPETFDGLRRGSCFLDVVINRLVAVVLDLPVEILLPEGGSSP
jgi:hypothetical protein